MTEALGQTDMGRDLLAQDYVLKQITASLIYPENELGKKFWDKVYAKAQQMYGTTEVPINTFNKVWIMADRAEVFERNQTVFVTDSHLKVMLEEDYLALQKQLPLAPSLKIKRGENAVSSQIIREIILPELEKEVNTGKNFANLRQIFNSIILASWYKKNLSAKGGSASGGKHSILAELYVNKSTVKGIDLNDPTIKEQIYQQYLKAYKKGVFNYISAGDGSASGGKEDDLWKSPVRGGANSSLPPVGRAREGGNKTTPRKYFSGGINPAMALDPAVVTDAIIGSQRLATSLRNDRALVSVDAGMIVHGIGKGITNITNIGIVFVIGIVAGSNLQSKLGEPFWKVVERARRLELTFSTDISTFSVESFLNQKELLFITGKDIVRLTGVDPVAFTIINNLKLNKELSKGSFVLPAIHFLPLTINFIGEWTDEQRRELFFGRSGVNDRYVEMKRGLGDTIANAVVTGVRTIEIYSTEPEFKQLQKTLTDAPKDAQGNPMVSHDQAMASKKKEEKKEKKNSFETSNPKRKGTAGHYNKKPSESSFSISKGAHRNKKSDPATVTPLESYGGIDLDTSRDSMWKVSKDGKGVEMNVDPAMVERIRREGIDSLSPVIFKITPITSVWPLIGLQEPKHEGQLAGV